jgi:endonuclease YncB( thermonuclease family)
MRKILPVLAVLVAAMAAVGAVQVLRRPAPPPAPIAVAAIPVPDTATQAAAPQPAPAEVAAAATPPVPRAPDLPVREIAARPYNVVPEDDGSAPVPHITLETQAGKPIERSAALAPQAAALARPPRMPSAFGGAARATGGFSLAVEGHAVQLFGVRQPESRDRCAARDGSIQQCSEAARAALAARLAGSAKVNCHMPLGQSGDPTFVCRDSSGADLGELLVSQGLALADTAKSYNYLGVEGIARSSQRGLWHYR